MSRELDNINKSRYELLKSHFKQKNLFNREWLMGEYLANSRNFVEFCKEQIIKRITDWDGIVIFSRYNIWVEIDTDLLGIDARIKQKGKRQLLITLSIDLILWVELLAINNILIGRLKKDSIKYEFEKLPDNPLSGIYSNFFKETINEYEIKSLNQSEQESIYYFLTKDVDYHYWGYTSYYALTWIIYHEFAHFLCGHSGFYLEQSGKKENSEFIEKMGFVVPDLDEFRQLLKWSSELSADSYATFRLAFHVSQEFEEGQLTLSENKFTKANEVIDILVNSPTTSLSVLDLLVLEEVDDYDVGNSFYPPLKVRILNLYISIKYIWFPSYHQYWDARRNLLAEYYQKKFPIDQYQMYDKLIFRNFSFRDEATNRKGLFLPISNYYDLAAFIGTLDGWRLGYTIPDEYLKKSHLRQIIFSYCSSMRSLCVALNSLFSKHLKGEWFTRVNYYEKTEHLDPKFLEGFAMAMSTLNRTPEESNKIMLDRMNAAGLINDPAYKVLDDWMSNICEVHYKKPFDVIFNEEYFNRAYKAIKILEL